MFGNLSKLFHRQTDYEFKPGTLPRDPATWPDAWNKVLFKEYPRMIQTALPRDFLKIGDLVSALVKRHSERKFDPVREIPLRELSTLFYYSAGVKNLDNPEKEANRFYPSGGSRYPLEVYLGVRRVESLNPGIYHYNVKSHSLEFLAGKREMNALTDAILYPWAKDAALYIILTAVWDRNFMKYENRGYRMVLIEAGHMVQNANLLSTALGIKSCDLAGFSNAAVNKMLDIDREDESSLYLVALGK